MRQGAHWAPPPSALPPTLSPPAPQDDVRKKRKELVARLKDLTAACDKEAVYVAQGRKQRDLLDAQTAVRGRG